ncbi:PREDICTED: light-inducible protein CPRF2-like [Populus euphratica]|uniref:Light-inducible protein CPRF2-like n=1 Tax=Populus euphratica TaxID=75702 RepID=A0AAJ6XPC4_POPEU|nr:PREDICTED: light-inducible protein CPRF2-like [Populus euphratica]XP_011026070.1 PREDICTED: light-inducible protein CPRF2-like [Populus euphratica]
MNSVFSVDDFSDPFWLSPPPPPPPPPSSTDPKMNRSESEWAFENFLQEMASVPSSASETQTAAPSVLSQSSTSSIPPDNGEDEVVEITKHPIHHHHHQIPNPHPQPLDRNLTAPVDSEEYRALLKSKLELACAAVAMSMETNAVKPEVFSSLPEDQRLAARNMSLGTQSFHNGTDQGISMAQIGANGVSLGIPALPTTQRKSDGESLGIPALPTTQRKQEVQARQTTSGSSREDSDDDDLEGDTGTNENMDPADLKRVRRMQSNRESARRSRRRKQAQLNELETQVGQLRDERTSLLSRFTDVNQKCDDAAVDNRILKADIETLRAKVKMAEEQVKRVTGLNPVLLARSSMPSPGMPFVGGQVDASTNVAVPMQTNPHQFFHQPVQGITPAPPHLQRLNNSFLNSTLVPLGTNPQTDNGNSNDGGMAVMPSMQLTADGQSLPAMPSMPSMPSMQQVQKQIGPTVSPAGTLPACDSGLPHVVAKDVKKK